MKINPTYAEAYFNLGKYPPYSYISKHTNS